MSGDPLWPDVQEEREDGFCQRVCGKRRGQIDSLTNGKLVGVAETSGELAE